MTEDEYLSASHGRGASGSNAGCRALVQRYFSRRSCRTLIRPCGSEADLLGVDAAGAPRARASGGPGGLRAHLAARLEPKRVQGSNATGRLPPWSTPTWRS